MEFPHSPSVRTCAEFEINLLLFSIILELSSMHKSGKNGIEYESILTEDRDNEHEDKTFYADQNFYE